MGNRLVGLIATLREEARLPFGAIQRLLGTLTGLGDIVDAVRRVANRAAPVVTALQGAIRASPVVHADETQWRENGRNGYVWTFSTPEVRLFLRGSRAKAMVPRVLGEDFSGVLVSDFYTAYTGYEGVHQYCWAHLLRDIHELGDQHPGDLVPQGWAGAVGTVVATAHTGATGSRADRWRVRTQAEAALKALCTPWLDPKVVQTTLCQRILRHRESLFVFVTKPAVPATSGGVPQDQRRDTLNARDPDADDAGIRVRDLAGAGD